MINLLTDEGTQCLNQALASNQKFLMEKALLLGSELTSLSVAGASTIACTQCSNTAVVLTAAGSTFTATVLGTMVFNSMLPVQVDTDSSKYAIDFNFTIAPTSVISYQSVLALGRMYHQVSTLVTKTYSAGDLVIVPSSAGYYYRCLTNNYSYNVASSTSPVADTTNWQAVSIDSTQTYVYDASFVSTDSDYRALYVSLYDDTVTVSQNMEVVYKLRIFTTAPNLNSSKYADFLPFARDGIEGTGSVALSFIAEISKDLQAMRNLVTTAG